MGLLLRSGGRRPALALADVLLVSDLDEEVFQRADLAAQLAELPALPRGDREHLAAQVRPVYDLYPRSIDMGWDLPDLRAVGGRNDLLGRI